VAYQTELIHEVAWLRRNMAEEEARGFSAALEAAIKACNEQAPDVLPQSSIMTQGRALGCGLCAEAIRALRPAQAQQGEGG
jgi:uncharacterized protein (DUF2267 family)